MANFDENKPRIIYIQDLSINSKHLQFIVSRTVVYERSTRIKKYDAWALMVVEPSCKPKVLFVSEYILDTIIELFYYLTKYLEQYNINYCKVKIENFHAINPVREAKFDFREEAIEWLNRQFKD